MDSSNESMVFRQMILDHYENPINKKIDDDVINTYSKYNYKSESCIDNLTVYLKIENNIVRDARFDGIGCAISTSSTDILCEMIKNKNKNEIKLILDNYFSMINSEPYDQTIIGDLKIFKNVNQQLNRIKCALVGVNSIKNIIDSN
ncbi:Fe-S cluster assembly sulfur transfer protein SufU [Malacoplasma iowae]|nr:SUF system NifU family Fe-S cluster assembly protein [Malacoplasma iowae]VEU61819.1 nitrogen fixation protein NifU [Mycoplasmopsis fermentans]EGZ30849.1 nitrogen fixation protein NifU [Malacoplasma iowae 695]QHG90108.2 SUF system NifU family Fe-S cluster assembly protein [Malacoplasma iowae 695]WPL36153.1 SUF system NifU family Fe-S cluster assembly protein [Malacoplasma iowae]WPL36402.1 SUF system NifU family Fe-S cluster assembly protein [Malacoplasma iowae]